MMVYYVNPAPTSNFVPTDFYLIVGEKIAVLQVDGKQRVFVEL
jgi:hypothetical protein